MGLTTDRNDPDLGHGTDEKPVPQNKKYLVLSEEERAKGFVRPVRETYIHVGKKLNYHSIDRVFDKPEKNELNGKYYVAVLNVMGSEGKIIGGSYVTQQELDAWKEKRRIGGCNTETTMAMAIAETYARDPNFYGSTYCVYCRKHLPVGEFVWKGTDEEVGS